LKGFGNTTAGLTLANSYCDAQAADKKEKCCSFLGKPATTINLALGGPISSGIRTGANGSSGGAVGGDSAGLLSGLLIGTLVLVLGAGGAVYHFYRRRRQIDEKDGAGGFGGNADSSSEGIRTATSKGLIVGARSRLSFAPSRRGGNPYAELETHALKDLPNNPSIPEKYQQSQKSAVPNSPVVGNNNNNNNTDSLTRKKLGPNATSALNQFSRKPTLNGAPQNGSLTHRNAPQQPHRQNSSDVYNYPPSSPSSATATAAAQGGNGGNGSNGGGGEWGSLARSLARTPQGREIFQNVGDAPAMPQRSATTGYGSGQQQQQQNGQGSGGQYQNGNGNGRW
jgi:hypothetical protein